MKQNPLEKSSTISLKEVLPIHKTRGIGIIKKE